MINLLEDLKIRIASGLKRQSISSASEYATNYRIMGPPYPGPYSFLHHPWTKSMHDATETIIVGRKAAQMGFTETALNKCFKANDIDGLSVLYILPAERPDAYDFSSARFEAALENSPHLRDMYSDVKNVGHKRAGNASLYIRGSRSRGPLKSIPVALIIFDEVDEMVQKNIPLAFERSSGQPIKQFFMISTPTIDNMGIDKYYRVSTQDHYFFKCPHCSRFIELSYPDSLVIIGETDTDPRVIESHIVCNLCHHPLAHENKIDYLSLANANWQTQYSGRPNRGFHINQMYSMTVPPYELAMSYLRGLKNPADEQEFYNSKMGLPHTVEGSRITDEMLDACKTEYKKVSTASGLVTMGVDVGKWLHVEIDKWRLTNENTNDINVKTHAQLLWEGKVQEFSELDTLMRQYGVGFCVIDANPERRLALAFAKRFHGHVRLCFYSTGTTNKTISIADETYDLEEEYKVSVDRTSYIDLAFSRFKTRKISLPFDLSTEYQNQIKVPVRVYKKDVDGNPVGRYESGSEDDHFAHARVYAEIAMPFLLGLGTSQNINKVY